MSRRFDEPGSEQIDLTRPSVARMYDFYLRGKDNFEVDREAARKVAAAAPSLPQAARANRAFMARAVRWCAEQGIDQFLDIGTGIPTSPNVVEVARQVQPDSVVVGIDNDPVVLSHDRALVPGMRFVAGDLCDPPGILEHPVVNTQLDLDRPVAVLLVAVLHFVTDEQNPAGIVAAFGARVAPGSVVIISHVCSTGADPEAVAQVEEIYADANAPGVFRTHEQIQHLFDGLQQVPPGVVRVQDWPRSTTARTAVPVLGGIGRKDIGHG